MPLVPQWIGTLLLLFPIFPDGVLSCDLAPAQKPLQLELVNIVARACMSDCLSGSGERLVLRFALHVENRGSTPCEIGRTPQCDAETISALPTLNSPFSHDSCSKAWVFPDYYHIALQDGQGRTIVEGNRQGRCIMDSKCSARTLTHYSCRRQGISSQCEDVSERRAACQWLDVTDIVAGGEEKMREVTSFTLRVNPLGRLEETDYGNNAVMMPVDLVELSRRIKNGVVVGGLGGSCRAARREERGEARASEDPSAVEGSQQQLNTVAGVVGSIMNTTNIGGRVGDLSTNPTGRNEQSSPTVPDRASEQGSTGGERADDRSSFSSQRRAEPTPVAVERRSERVVPLPERAPIQAPVVNNNTPERPLINNNTPERPVAAAERSSERSSNPVERNSERPAQMGDRRDDRSNVPAGRAPATGGRDDLRNVSESRNGNPFMFVPAFPLTTPGTPTGTSPAAAQLPNPALANALQREPRGVARARANSRQAAAAGNRGNSSTRPSLSRSERLEELAARRARLIARRDRAMAQSPPPENTAAQLSQGTHPGVTLAPVPSTDTVQRYYRGRRRRRIEPRRTQFQV